MILGKNNWVSVTIQKMSIEEKIAQMFFYAVKPVYSAEDNEYYQYLKYLIKDVKIGGIHIFPAPAYEAAYLINKYQSWAEIPLLVSADMERGAGNIIKNELHNYGESTFLPEYLTGGGVHFPPFMALGATRSEELAYQMGKITAIEGLSVGINYNFAPVMDININPDNPIINIRSFGEDKEIIKKLGVSYIKGVQDSGMIATAKHFPGHGDTDKDTHIELPILNFDMRRLEDIELQPFSAAIEGGVKSIMIAHIALPSITGTKLPATLSEKIVNDILRKKLNFKGLIISDAMVMGGIKNNFDTKTSASLAIKAGVDILLLFEKPDEVIKTVLKTIKKGEISEKRIDESVKRILIAKKEIGLDKKKTKNLDYIQTVLGKKEHFYTAKKIAENSVTLLKNKDNILPIKEDEKIFFIKISGENNPENGIFLQHELEKYIDFSGKFYLWKKTCKEEVENILNCIEDNSVLICPSYFYKGAWKGNIQINKNIVEFFETIQKKGCKIVLISFGCPYIYRSLSFVDSYICAYYSTKELEETVAKILVNKHRPAGKLPVSIPKYFNYGDGLTF